MAVDTWTAPRERARRGLRRCVVCKSDRPVEDFTSPQSRKCNGCKASIMTRACERCAEIKPTSDYVYRGRVCSDCRAGPPRACLRCHEVKAAVAFGFGDGRRAKGPVPCYRRRRGVCLECEARAAAEREQRMAARRRTWEDPATGRLVRMCSGACGEVKDLADDFYDEHRSAPGIVGRKSYRCKRCTVERVSAYAKARAAAPETRDLVRADRRRWQRSWRKRNPEAYRRAQADYEARLLADPVRHARRLENDRIAYRLRRERRGLPVRGGSSSATMGTERSPSLPAKPLADLVERLFRAERGPVRASGDVTFGVFCKSVGIDERNVRGWRSGEFETVTFGVVDRILTLAGRFVWDVWPEADYPAVHEALFG
jgi:hypothetical protein